VRLYRDATRGQQSRLRQDMQHMVTEQGMSAEEYLEGLATWPGDAASYLAESGYDKEEEQEQDGAADGPGHAEQAAADAAKAKAEAEAKEAAEQEAAQRAADKTLDAATKAFAKGEREYRKGLLEAGRLCSEYTGMRLAMGVSRDGAVQAIGGALARYATGKVDVNRLIRGYHAWRLLCEAAGLGKKGGEVPYGHYRDYWCQLVERTTEKASETYTLLPGIEDRCLATFRQALEMDWDADAIRDAVQLLQRQHSQEQEVMRKADAERARREAEAKAGAAEEAKGETAEAEAARKAAEKAAKEADEAARKAKGAERAKREAEAEAARKALDQARKEEAEARLRQEQEAREAARAKEEARQADKRQAEAEAERKRLEDKAERKTAKGNPASEQSAKPEPGEARAENLLKAATRATSKDLGDMVRAMLQGHEDPQAALFDTIASLLASPSGELPADMVVRSIFLALEQSKVDGQAGEAVKAARLVLNRKPHARPSA
jgi:hypothetical protein